MSREICNARVLVVVLLVGMTLSACCNPVQADVVTTVSSADTLVSARPDLQAYNFGGFAHAKIGYDDGHLHDWADALVRFDLSAYAGRTATGPATLTLSQWDVSPPLGFNGYHVDLYESAAANANWEEGVGGGTAGGGAVDVAGVAYNRMKGPYSTTPPAGDQWVGGGPEAGATKLASHQYLNSEGTSPIVFTLSQSDVNRWIGAGSVSLMIRSDDAIAEDEALTTAPSVGKNLTIALRESTVYAGPTLSFDVPEPSAFALLGMALLSLLAYAWKKRK
jgi:hypothetical protein